jgi:hypothetical protein
VEDLVFVPMDMQRWRVPFTREVLEQRDAIGAHGVTYVDGNQSVQEPEVLFLHTEVLLSQW